MRGIDPDVLVISPLVTDQSTQVDLIKAARRFGVRSALCVASWDHLTTKGLMRIQPDLVALWNHAQRREAIEFHGVEADRIVVTGAQCFDRWFDRTPRRTRADFCARVGLRPDRPFVVFVGSTASISTPAAEVQFVTRWIAAVRNGPGSLSDLGILIRPHPYNSVHWGAVDLSEFPDVAVYPRHGANPVDTDDRADYYDTLHHGAAIVGINTSALIEAGIQNRPVFTIVDASFDDTQTGTLHFRYLLPENGGHLQHAASLDEHTRQLSATIEDGAAPSAQAFIKAFVRPHGLDAPATPRLVEALEQLADRPARTPAPLPLYLWPVRAGLWTLAVWLRLIDVHYWRRLLLRLRTGLRTRVRLWRHYPTIRKFLRESNPRRVLKRLRQRRYHYEMALWQYYKTKRKSLREWRAAAVRRRRFDPMSTSDQTDEVMAAGRIAAEAWDAHLASRRATPVYQAYERVRRQVLGLQELGRNRRLTGHAPSDYWSGELAKFEYMLDASPLIVDTLRQHTHNLTGLHANHYRPTLHKHRRRFAEKLEALRALDDGDLWVPESRLLGGFGFDIEGELVNLDTLKFYEVLIAMQIGAVLPEMRQATERKLVWEIGSGWGGFPYQFKKLCPNVTYVITDFPELFLFSATYLMAAFPEATVRFYGEVPPQETFSDWRNLDFIFLPDTFHAAARPEQVDLMINMVSFQEMTTQQVTAYVRRAFDLECPYLYSLNRDRSGHNPELSHVRSIIGQFYWPHQIDVLPISLYQDAA